MLHTLFTAIAFVVDVRQLAIDGSILGIARSINLIECVITLRYSVLRLRTVFDACGSG